MTAAITAVNGFEGGTYYEAPVGAMLGAVGGFTAAVLVEPFAFENTQVLFANTDGATRGWQISLTDLTLEVRVFHNAPGSTFLTHTLTAGDMGRLLLPALVFDGAGPGTLYLVVNGSLVDSTTLPPGAVYLPAVTRAALGASSGGAASFNGGVVGAAYSDQAYIPQLMRAHWVACQSARDMVDGGLGSLLGPLVMPTFDHLYSARRSNNGGPGALPVPPFPFLAAGAVWPDDRGTGGAVNFDRVGTPFVITVRDGI